MLIHWEWDENTEALLQSQDFSAVVGELLRARRLGAHLIVIDRRLAARLQELDLTQSDRALLQRLGSEFTQTGSLYRFSPVYIRISSSQNNTVSKVGSALIIPLGLIVGSRILELPILLVENIENDGWILEFCLKISAELFKRGPISFEISHGGGDDIHKVLPHIIRTGRAVHVIVDSDRDSPHPQQIGKMKRLTRVIGASDSIIARATALPCREAENLVPLEILLQTATALGRPLNKLLLEIQDTENNSGAAQNDRLNLYIDLKEGLSQERINSMSQDDREWILSKLSLAGLDETTCNFDGYGAGIVPQIKDNGSLVAQFRHALKEQEWRTTFSGFFDPICWFYLGATRLVT